MRRNLLMTSLVLYIWTFISVVHCVVNEKSGLVFNGMQSPLQQYQQEATDLTDSQLLELGLYTYGIENPNEKRLVLYNEADGEIKVDVITEIDKFKFLQLGIKFQDITQYWDQYIELDHQDELDIDTLTNYKIRSDVTVKKYKYPKPTEFHEKDVFKLIKDIDTSFIFQKLSNFTSFYSRYYKADSGFESQLWLYEQIVSLIPEDYLEFTNITLFDHKSWKQQSIIVTIFGQNAKKKNGVYVDRGPTVVLGAHQDSANAIFPKYLKAPGADDDGSGSITILETLRIILQNKVKFVNTVEFHFYSAEELGLLGSLDVFNHYKEKGITVVSMLQQDMTGFIQKTIDKQVPEHLGVTTDYTSDVLYDFVISIIETYCLIPARATKCGYACSDHSSALQNGYPSIMVIEALFEYTDPNIHSTGDTIDKLSLTHIAENVKMDLGYLYELGHWKTIEEDGVLQLKFGSFGFQFKRWFYRNFDTICLFMVAWITLSVLVFVKLLKEAGIKSKFVKLLKRRKYHFLNSV